jgi:dipeptidyl-peptidase-4
MHYPKMLAVAFAAALTLAVSPIYAQNTSTEPRPVTLDDVWGVYAFGGKSINGLRSMADGVHYTRLTRGEGGSQIEKFDFATGTSKGVLITSKELETGKNQPFAIQNYTFSPDEQYLLLETDLASIYRHSYTAKVGLYKIKDRSFVSLGDKPVQNAQLSPNGKWVAYVEDNNVWLFDVATGERRAVTTDGVRNRIINGAPDWVYEEEFSFHVALWWSPNSEHLAFLRFDETDVASFSMDVYGSELYPSQQKFKYPKAGEANSKVTLHAYSLSKQTITPMAPGLEYEYLPRVQWTPKNELAFMVLNRLQNHLRLYTQRLDGAPRLWLEEKDAAYVEVTDQWEVLPDGSLVWASEAGGYNQLYWISADGKKRKALTDASSDVTDYYGTDAKGTVFYQAAGKSAAQREVYAVSVRGGKPRTVAGQPGTNQGTFNKTLTYFILTHQSAQQPPRIGLYEASGKEIRVLEDNAALTERLKKFKISPKIFEPLKLADGRTLPSWRILPLNYQAGKKYPVLMFVYGGPGSQQVLDVFGGRDYFWYQHLASLGYMVVCVDNRGTGAQGREFKKCTYQQLGKLEVEDQIAAAKSLALRPDVDPARLAIWGWSYGGYMSSNCILKGADVFKAAMAVAPVTNWRFYDNIYTERFMRTPAENGPSYDANSPLSHADKLKGSFLLVHGTGDDNVHVQNSMRLAEALIQANKPFDYMVYPDKNHGISGGKTRLHLYTLMTQFLLENL